MSKILSKETGITKYNQSANAAKTGTSTTSGTSNRNSNSTATGKQTSDSETKQVSEKIDNRVSNSVRDLSSVAIRTGSTIERANIAFQISFSIPIKGKVPNSKSSC